MAIVTQIKSDTVENVARALDSEPSIRLDMNRGLINVRALARYIINKKKVDGTLDSVISAIRRYHIKDIDDIYEKAHNSLKMIQKISLKNQLVSIAITKNNEIQMALPKLFSIINYSQGDVLRIIQADESIKIVVDGKNLDKTRSLFTDDKILKITYNLAEIDIHANPDNQIPPGVCALIANELAVHDINILENMSCHPESLWFVEEKDITKAYDVIYKLCYK